MNAKVVELPMTEGFFRSLENGSKIEANGESFTVTRESSTFGITQFPMLGVDFSNCMAGCIYFRDGVILDQWTEKEIPCLNPPGAILVKTPE